MDGKEIAKVIREIEKDTGKKVTKIKYSEPIMEMGCTPVILFIAVVLLSGLILFA